VIFIERVTSEYIGYAFALKPGAKPAGLRRNRENRP
jgi:hypothetical protein